MVNATVRRRRAPRRRRDAAQAAVADAGSWHHEQMDSLAADGIQVLIAPDANKRQGARPGWHGGRYEWMRRVLSTELWPTALPNTLTDDRADVRAHQAQPQDEPLSPTRQVGRPHAMAPDDRHPQPHQAPQPHPRGRHRVNRAAIAPTTIEPDPPTRHRQVSATASVPSGRRLAAGGDAGLSKDVPSSGRLQVSPADRRVYAEPSTNPVRYASATAWTRSRSLSFVRMWLTWVLTVALLR